ncbi:AraC family transcriptional regulator [Clostridium sporogenes]|uniref:AraC family transcriptional regulator n=1 Tax=Clostridium botulinum TaxID=1491 RepID=A0A6M0T2B8_CLOBO|nr:AraC family transcriptional regulator [Clostridium sporogenes]NFA61937.1 AraC family transcriptional regulator [Clostridium botulinum]NFI72622.1 helix-turn-helix transcriptional regulator [Clostridium sporogenes]NFL72866.1 helix-turn-helix transcriptional regulator [Clostridium sporogenes]NFM25754.1 helix-turn-helix transcriptional regulator [Clostridium sporogenes]NFP62720.1 helix-turn-helix transcriptional regulator [Clostridium sporogenes]
MEERNIKENYFMFDKITTVIEKDIDDYRTVYKMNCQEGYGFITVYQVFPGIRLLYNEFDAISCYCGKKSCDNIMEINYCLEGRLECELQNGFYLYIGEGDFSGFMMNNHSITTGFPLKHYRGISVELHLDEIEYTLSTIMKEMFIDIRILKDKLISKNQYFIMKARDEIKRIFSELYSVSLELQKPYFKLKTLELLLFLSKIDICKEDDQQLYYPKHQVEVIKKIQKQMTDNLKRRYTIDDLAKEHGISKTYLKNCFKGVYGISIAAYMKKYRIEYAAVLLKQTRNSVAEIAVKVGYENQSKFAAAFREIMGVNPTEYRKINV